MSLNPWLQMIQTLLTQDPMAYFQTSDRYVGTYIIHSVLCKFTPSTWWGKHEYLYINCGLIIISHHNFARKWHVDLCHHCLCRLHRHTDPEPTTAMVQVAQYLFHHLALHLQLLLQLPLVLAFLVWCPPWLVEQWGVLWAPKQPRQSKLKWKVKHNSLT